MTEQIVLRPRLGVDVAQVQARVDCCPSCFSRHPTHSSRRRRVPSRPCPTASRPPRTHSTSGRRQTQTPTGGVFSRYGIASALLALLCVAAVAVLAVIWTTHHAAAAERTYQTNAMQAAADWTGVLINMNKDNVDDSLQKLHDGTVGQLNADFEASIEPYRDVVQTLQSQTTGRIEAVAIEKIHRDLDTAPGAPAAQPHTGAAARNGRAHRHGHGGRDVGESERRRPAADRALESAPRRLRRGRPAARLAAGVHAVTSVVVP